MMNRKARRTRIMWVEQCFVVRRYSRALSLTRSSVVYVYLGEQYIATQRRATKASSKCIIRGPSVIYPPLLRYTHPLVRRQCEEWKIIIADAGESAGTARTALRKWVFVRLVTFIFLNMPRLFIEIWQKGALCVLVCIGDAFMKLTRFFIWKAKKRRLWFF